jgi:hypothetical protein
LPARFGGLEAGAELVDAAITDMAAFAQISRETVYQTLRKGE